MTRFVLPALGGALVVAFGLYVWESNRHAETKAALELATAYIESTKDIDNAFTDLPTNPDDVLSELCRIAPRGEGCGDPGPGAAGSDSARGGPNLQ